MKHTRIITTWLLVVTLITANIGTSYAVTDSINLTDLQKKQSDEVNPLSNRYYYRVVTIYNRSYKEYVSQREATSRYNYELFIKSIASLIGIPLGFFGGFCSVIMGAWTTPMSREGTYSIKEYKLENRKYDRLTNTYRVVRTGVKLHVSHKGESTTYQYWLK